MRTWRGGATETPPTATGTNEPEAGPTEIPTMAAKTNVPEGGAIETQVQNLDATLVRRQILQLSPLPKAPPHARKRQAQAASVLTSSPYKESLENAQASKRGMGRGVRVRGGTARGVLQKIGVEGGLEEVGLPQMVGVQEQQLAYGLL